MTRKALLLLLLASSLALTACLGDDEDGPRSVTGLVSSLIANSTDEDSTPIALNDLPISDAGTNETSLPMSIN